MVAIVYTAAAHMPSSCKGHYRRVMVLDVRYDHAILHLLGKWRPHACNAKEVKAIVRDFGAQSVGKTPRCAYQVALREAEELARRYNGAGDMAEAEQLISTGSA